MIGLRSAWKHLWNYCCWTVLRSRLISTDGLYLFLRQSPYIHAIFVTYVRTRRSQTAVCVTELSSSVCGGSDHGTAGGWPAPAASSTTTRRVYCDSAYGPTSAWTIMHHRTVPSQSNRRVMWTDSAKLVLYATRRSTFGVVLFQRRPHVPGMHYHLTSVPHHRSSLTDECSNWHMFQTSFPNSLALAFKTLSVCWYVYMLFVQCSCKLLPWHNSNKCFNGNNNNNNNNTKKKKNKNESRNIRTADLRQSSGSRKILTILIISRGCKNFV